jgi:multiple sugar transport system permease protein
MRRFHPAYQAFIYASAVILALVTLLPFAWMVVSSLVYKRDLTAVPMRLDQMHFSLDRYVNVFTNPRDELAQSLLYAMGNSLTVALVVTAVSLATGALASYAFARLRFLAKRPLLYLVLFTYMVPPVVLVIPLYVAVNALGLLDQKVTLIILYLSMSVPFVVWVMQSYFGSIGRSFEEAALMDGCSRFQTLWHIYLPMARPGLVATGILAFLLAWDEFLFGLIFTSTLAAKTIPVAIAEFTGKNNADFGMIATGGVLASLPPLIIAVLFQKQIVTGMTGGGNKE